MNSKHTLLRYFLSLYRNDCRYDGFLLFVNSLFVLHFGFWLSVNFKLARFLRLWEFIWKKRKNFYTDKPPLSNCNRYSKTQTGRFLTCLKKFFNLLHNSILQHLTKKREWVEIGFVFYMVFWRFQGVKSYSKRIEKGVLEHKKRTAHGKRRPKQNRAKTLGRYKRTWT